jgi:hypothetical protein
MLAYIGPGGGMEFFAYGIGLIVMLGAALLSVLMLPFYTVMRWLRRNKSPAAADQSTNTASAADVSAIPPPPATSDSGQATPPTQSVS